MRCYLAPSVSNRLAGKSQVDRRGPGWSPDRNQRTHRHIGPGQTNYLAVLLDALDGVALSDGERASLTWLAGFEVHTVENIAAVITRARQTR